MVWVSLSELHEDDTSGLWKCRLCSATVEKDSFKQHILTHTKQKTHETTTGFRCEHCSKLFSSRKYLRVHIRCIHINSSKYPCSMCDKAFPRGDYLRRHISRAHENTFYTCQICDKSYKDHAHYKDHVKTHMGAQYQCNECKRVFGYRAALVRHLKVHKQSTSG